MADALRSSLSPVVEHVVSVLEDRIGSGEYEDGRRLPSERAIADEFDVSRLSVRAAIAELERRSVVSRAPNCRPVVRTRHVRARSTPVERRVGRRSIGLWISGDPNDFGGAMTAQGVRRALDQSAYRLVVAGPSGGSHDAGLRSEAEALLRMAHDEDITGVLLWYLGGARNLPALHALREAEIPLMFLDREPPEGFQADYVGVDNEFSAREVVNHLLQLGHRRIAHVSNEDPGSTVAARRSAYRQALAAARLPFSQELLVTASFLQPNTPEEHKYYEDLVDRLLGLPDPPTAIWAVNDSHALRVLAALRSRGVRVPEEVALAGFDGIERCLPGPSFLTTAWQPFERMGARAVERLQWRIEHGPTAPYQHLIMDAPISIHGSTQADDLASTGVRQIRNS